MASMQGLVENCSPNLMVQQSSKESVLFLETTGLSVDTVEIGVKVNHFEFQSLVRTSQDIPTIVESLTGIKNADLSDKDINRSQLDTAILVDHNIHFADRTLALLQKAKKDGCEIAKLGLKALFNKFFPNKEFIGHRAIADVEAMEELDTSTTLGDLLPKLNIRTPQEQIQLWTTQKQKRANVRQLQNRFRTITKEHAHRYITFEILNQWKDKAENTTEFNTILRGKKVRSTALREKLCLFFFGLIILLVVWHSM